MTSKYVVLSILACIAFSRASIAAEETQTPAQAPPEAKKEDYYHVCNNDDLLNGAWKLVLFKENPRRKEYSWYKHMHYQYIAFLQDNLYSYVATNREIKTPLQLRKALLWPDRFHRSLTYTLDDQGVLNLYIDKRPTYSYRCLAIVKDKDEFKKGDLVLRGYTKGSKTLMYKLYRRWF